jgi:hypothetical protein
MMGQIIKSKWLYEGLMHTICYTFHMNTEVIIKFLVKVKFSLEQAMKAQRGSRGIALLFL